MPKILSIREETPAEKSLREWFAAQRLESPKATEEAARLLIGLITGLLGVLFGVLTVSAEKLPAYLSLPLVRWTGVSAVVLWLFSLLAALLVVVPRKWQAAPGLPQTQERTFSDLVSHKTRWLTISVYLFWAAVVMLGVVLVAALLTV